MAGASSRIGLSTLTNQAHTTLSFDSQFDSRGLGQARIKRTHADRGLNAFTVWTSADAFLTTSHVGNAGSTPAGITNQISHKTTRVLGRCAGDK